MTIMYLLMLLVSLLVVILRLFNSELLSSYCLSLIKAEYAWGYKTQYYAYTNKNLTRAKKRIGYLNSVMLMLSKRIRINTISRNTMESEFLLVASSLDKIGGHTRLIDYYFKGITGAKLFVSGDIRDRNLRQRQDDFKSIVSKIVGEENVFIADLSIEDNRSRIADYIANIVAINPQKIITFNAGSDILLLISLLVYRNINPDIKIYFYHHGDDYLQLLDDHFDLHIDVDHNADEKCKHIEERKLIRIATESRVEFNHIDEESITIFSFAPPRKIFTKDHISLFLETISYLSLLDKCNIVLASTSDNVDTYAALENMDCNMERIKIINDCYDIKECSYPIDLYLDTFPVGGGMAVIEALSLGVPIIINATRGYQVFRDPVLHQFMFYSITDINKYIKRLMADQVFRKEESDIAFKIFKNNYQIDTAINSLLSSTK
jgi:hypothetical protein